MPTPSLRLRLSTASLRAVERLRRNTERLRSFVEAFALAALSDEELGELTAQRYVIWNQRAVGTLAEWEARWFARDLPTAPSRILLGGAGRGRELTWLCEAGYDVLAFDPIAPTEGKILRMSYEDLWSPADAARGDAATRVRAGAPYDAILLGWTSFTHVPGAARRLRSLQALRSLSSGPLLLSYWSGPGGLAGSGRTKPLPRRVGRRLGEYFAAGEVAQDRQHDRIASHVGYAHHFSGPELDRLAAQCGYRAQHFSDGFAHTTLTPIATAGCTT